MTTYSNVKKWIAEIQNYSIPQMNESGLSRFVVNDTLIIHIVASPKPQASSSDSLYFYVPLMHIHLLDAPTQEKILWYIANRNMPAKLPENISLSASKESQYVWLNYRASTEHMNRGLFEKALEQFIFIANEERNNFLELTSLSNQSTVTQEMKPEEIMPQNILWG